MYVSMHSCICMYGWMDDEKEEKKEGKEDEV